MRHETSRQNIIISQTCKEVDSLGRESLYGKLATEPRIGPIACNDTKFGSRVPPENFGSPIVFGR